MLPYREWNLFDLVTLLRQSDNNADTTVEDWTTEHIDFGKGCAGKMGSFTAGIDIDQAFHPVFKPKDSSFELVTSMDQAVDYGFWYLVSLLDNSASEAHGYMSPYVLDDVNTVDYRFVNGKYYDGVVGNEWERYPPAAGHNYFESQKLLIADLPFTGVNWVEAMNGGTAKGNNEQVMFFKNGVYLHMTNWGGGDSEPFPVNHACLFWIDIQKIRVNYLNAVVNSLSRRRMLPGDVGSLVLTGLGFDQDDAELGSTDRYPGNNPNRNWFSLVDFIDFIGLQGQGTTTLDRVAGDFTVDSDLQITIPAMPGLALGTYDIRLRKERVTILAPEQVYSYAGDFRTGSSGLATPGSRMKLRVALARTGPPGPEIILTNWKFKRGVDEADRFYAPIDVRTPETFYDGRILRSSPINRAVDDQTGMFQNSVMSLDMANTDKEFSILLAQYLLKNQIVEILSATKGEDLASATPVSQMIVDDYDPKGPVFSVRLKDIMSKYFQKVLPTYRCTEADYPDIHPDHKGRRMPEIVGLASLTTGEALGAVEAIYVDTVNHKYLGARGSLHAVLQVYADGKLKTLGAHYAISYEDGGRTMITFTSNQKAKKITFNCEGYMFEDWNSVNEYVQNPAYVMAFLVSFFAELPFERIDLESFTALAAIFETLGIETSGKLILQDSRGASEVMQELLFTYGAKGFPANDGRFTVERKDISNYTTDLIFFEQLDILGDAQRKMNLNQAINCLQVKFDSIPTLNLYKGEDDDKRQSSIDDFEAEMEPSTPWIFPWTDSASWVAHRLSEELLKIAYGKQRLMISIPIQYIADVDIFSNFKFQDPYGFSLTGAGEVGRYYYVVSISFDHEGQKINIVAVDLQWLLRQYFILGDEDEIAALWVDAGEADRMYGYLCNELTDKFADDEPGKILMDENLIL